ncbi:hypothetical protein PVA8_295 [Vibrio phage PVA8]|nr:hypothetical protein [Vibrio phage PC-Liy1]URQ03281.1 hypothetical protein PVA8_295 [Vibrio phage PVA8]WBM59016.1 hypothetical protein vBValMPVA8_294 [Vibrio phage vB_ValM_PVA8]
MANVDKFAIGGAEMRPESGDVCRDHFPNSRFGVGEFGTVTLQTVYVNQIDITSWSVDRNNNKLLVTSGDKMVVLDLDKVKQIITEILK